MNKVRWQYIKALTVVPRLVHQSCAVAMLPHPSNPEGPRVIPWIERPGKTLNIGRNAAKRALRNGARKIWRVLPKADRQ